MTTTTYGANSSTRRNIVFNKISGKTPWCSPTAGTGAPTTRGISRTTERTKLARRPRQRNRERDGSSPGEERWPISRYSAHMPRPTIRRSCGGIASLHRAALLARIDGITFINAHGGSPATGSCELPFIRLLREENYRRYMCKQFLFDIANRMNLTTFIHCYEEDAKCYFRKRTVLSRNLERKHLFVD